MQSMPAAIFVSSTTRTFAPALAFRRAGGEVYCTTVHTSTDPSRAKERSAVELPVA